MNSAETQSEIASIISEVKRLASRYYVLTKKPLGVSGEIAEVEAARILDLQLSEAREPSVDAIRIVGDRVVRIQVKGRAVNPKKKYVGRVPKIKLSPTFDVGLLVLLDKFSFNVIEIWEADFASIEARLTFPGSKSRNQRGSMAISQFKSIAKKVWPT